MFLILQFFIVIERLLRIIVNSDDLSLALGNLHKGLAHKQIAKIKDNELTGVNDPAADRVKGAMMGDLVRREERGALWNKLCLSLLVFVTD